MNSTNMLPDWPRMLSRSAAAAYCGLSVTCFEQRCPVQPIRMGSRKLWDRRAIDAWLDQLGGTMPHRPSNMRYLEALDDDGDYTRARHQAR